MGKEIKIRDSIKEKEMATRAIGDMAIFYGDKQNTGDYDNGIWMDLLDIPYIQQKEEAGLYNTVIRTLWLEATGWTKELRDRFPHVTQIGLSDHPLSTHISKMSADRQYAYLADLDYLDGLMALTYEEEQFYQAVLPSKPVVRVGLPFPVENYEEKYGSLRNSEREYIGLGVGAADNDRNFISNLLVFQNLKLRYPDLQGVFLSVPHQLMPYCMYMADKFDGVYIHQRTNMGEYLEILNRCKFVISLPDRNTPGRLQGEAAFFKIPVVGSYRLELQDELFPLLSVQPFALQDAIELSERLLEDPTWAATIGEEAHLVLTEEYNYAKSKERFNLLVSKIKGEEIAGNNQSKSGVDKETN